MNYVTSVLVVGAGGTGLRAAVKAAASGQPVTLMVKGLLNRCGATNMAHVGDLNVDGKSIGDVLGLPGDPRDSKESFFEDMVVEGRYLNNQKLVQVHVNEAPGSIQRLREMGAKINLVHPNMPGHRFTRGVFAPGGLFTPTLVKEARRLGVTILEDTMLLDLLKTDGKVNGAIGLDMRTGKFVTVEAKAVVLATGGWHQAYSFCDGPEESTGDGQAAALRAGASLVDMEMVQFLYATIWPPAHRGVLVPFTLGTIVGPHFFNRFGERFMEKWDPVRMEKSSRDIMARAMATEILAGRGSQHGGVYFSYRHLPKNLIDFAADWYAHAIHNWRYGGQDVTDIFRRVRDGEAFEIAPACHFFMGGIQIDEKCRTTLEGLYAAGECTGGVHGGNRLSGNALTMVNVWGEIAGRSAAEYASDSDRTAIDKDYADSLERRASAHLSKKEGQAPIPLKHQIQHIGWERVGIIRTGDGLQEAIAQLYDIRSQAIHGLALKSNSKAYNREWVEAIQIENLATVLECAARAALMRTESRGAHYRTDYLETDNKKWLKNIRVALKDNELSFTETPAVLTKLRPEVE